MVHRDHLEELLAQAPKSAAGQLQVRLDTHSPIAKNPACQHKGRQSTNRLPPVTLRQGS